MLPWLRLILLYLLLLPQSGLTDSSHNILTLEQARRVSLQGSAQVTLPDHLPSTEYAASGSLVDYYLEVVLPAAPDSEFAIYIPKLSLAGRITLNGQDLGSCAVGALDELRCHLKPLMFATPAGSWQAGPNQLQIQIYADDRQMNGLSSVMIGPLTEIYWNHYLPRRLVQVDLVLGLTWISLCLSLLSLAVFYVLRNERVYLWFSLASMANALSNLNVLVNVPLISVEFFSWFVFSSRYVSLTLIYLTLLSIFNKDTRTLSWLAIGLTILVPLMIWLSGNSRWLTAAAYLPLSAISVTFAVLVLRWSWQSRRALHVIISVICLLILYSAAQDWLRLSGLGEFEGFYLMVYTLTTVMLLIGGMLVAVLASALQTSRSLAAALDTKVAERTLALEQANQQLTEISRTDSLTGLANRRRYDEMLTQEWERAQRTGSSLSLISIDIDWFKPFNDNYGHPAGDVCLRKVAAILQTHVQRGADLLARIGGEEFAVVATTNPNGVLQFAEKLRTAVAEAAIQHEFCPNGKVTISIGIATYDPETDKELSQLSDRADQALYKAKSSGRNCVVHSG